MKSVLDYVLMHMRIIHDIACLFIGELQAGLVRRPHVFFVFV